MLLKFTVNLLKTAPKITAASFYSTNKNTTHKPKNWHLQVAEPKDKEEILNFMEKNFLKEEPMTRALIPGQKPKIMRKLMGDSLDHGLSVIARKLCEDKGIVGVVINELSCKLDGEKLCKMTNEIEDCNVKKLLEALAYMTREPKLHEKLCLDEIFNIGMLSVAECYYGQGIGRELMKRSLELARDEKFQYAKTICTSDNTRKIAEKLNMQKIWSAPYKEILCRGSIKPRAFPDPPHNIVNVYIMDLKTLPPKCD